MVILPESGALPNKQSNFRASKVRAFAVSKHGHGAGAGLDPKSPMRMAGEAA
jgi:hypothetical protein